MEWWGFIHSADRIATRLADLAKTVGFPRS